MTVEEFTMSYFTIGNKIESLVVSQTDSMGNMKKHDVPIGDIRYLAPTIRKAPIKRWWVDTKARKIIVCIKKEEFK